MLYYGDNLDIMKINPLPRLDEVPDRLQVLQEFTEGGNNQNRT
jgi:hypothetical protein